jgi:hypothetical protein
MKLEKPCTRNYSSMPVQEEGRHCSHCDKVVIDFRKMSEAELKSYFIQHSGERVCGKLKSYQVNEHSAFVKQILSFKNFVSDRINFAPLKLALLAMISSLLTFTTSCMGAVRPVERKPDQPKDSVQIKNTDPVKK